MTCKDCTKRYPGCHDHCDDYKKFRDDQNKINKERIKGWEYWSYMKDSYTRTERRNRKKKGAH